MFIFCEISNFCTISILINVHIYDKYFFNYLFALKRLIFLKTSWQVCGGGGCGGGAINLHGLP